MSDTESSYASDSDNSVASENEKIIINPNLDIKKVGGLPTIDTFGDDDDSDEEEPDEIDVDDEDEAEAEEEVDDDDNNDQIIMGGAKKVKAKEEEEDDTESEDDDEAPNKKVLKKSKTGVSAVNKSVNLQIDTDDEDDDDDDFDDNYLQKFDSETTKNYVHEFHPECLHHNYDEVAKFTAVVRDSDNIIIDPFHKTIPYLTKYERARILGQRAKQIEAGAKPLVKVPDNIVDGHIIADLELQQKRIPFIIRRPIPGGAFEYWNLKDLEIIAF
jgi:DNA-directed RNA polymerase I, II, and III subunit RPABC2